MTPTRQSLDSSAPFLALVLHNPCLLGAAVNTLGLAIAVFGAFPRFSPIGPHRKVLKPVLWLRRMQTATTTASNHNRVHDGQ